jgi:ribonuclease J
MYEWIRPEIIVPVHGEMRHMAEQARFARSRGIPHGIVQKNGDLIRLAPDGPEKLSEERVGRLILDGDVILPADGDTMNQRRKLGQSGMIAVAVPLDADDRPAGGIDIDPRGVPAEEDRDAFVAEARDAAAKAAAKAAGNLDKLREDVRLAVRRAAADWTGKKPVVAVLTPRARP